MVKLQLGEILRRGLTSTRAISALGLAIWLPWGILRIIYRAMISSVPVSIVGLLATTTIVSVTAVVASGAIRVTLLRSQPSYRSGAWLTLASYLILLLIIGFTQELAESSFGTGVGFSAARLATGLIGLYLVACLLEYFVAYRDDLVRLRAEQDKLNDIRQANARDLTRLRSQLVVQLVAQLNAPMANIKNRLGELFTRPVQAGTMHALADEIRDSLIAPVREASYEIPQAGFFEPDIHKPANSGPTYSVEPVAARPPRRFRYAVRSREGVVNWREVGRSVPTQRPFYPLLVAAATSIFSLSNTDLLDPRGLAISIAAYFSVTFGLFLLAKRLLSDWLAQLSLIRAWIFWLLTVFAISAAGTSAAFFVYSKFDGSNLALVLVGALLASGVAVVVSLCATIFTEAHAATASVILAVQLTSQKAAALQQELESTKQQIAHVLHGEVQSMLTSAAFRLDLAAENLETGSDVKATSEAIDEARTMLDGAISKVESIAADQPHQQTATGGLGLQERIDDVCRSWAGIVSIESTMNQETASRLEARVNEASLAPVVTEIVREAILNAVRHATAGNVQVAIESTESVCQITVTNDGASPGFDTSTGLGLETLNQLGYQWSLMPGERGGGVLAIELPLLILVAAE